MHVRDVFISRGIRCTRQRAAIYEALSATDAHPSAEELYELVKPRCPGVSLATVYNTLEAFCEAGLVRKLPVTHGVARYDADLHPHLHVIDEASGRFIDVPDELGDDLLSSLPPKALKRIEETLRIRIGRVSIQLVATPARADSDGA